VAASWGLGTALLQHSFLEMRARGMRKASLGVDGENTTGAVRLYERAGMDVDRRYDCYRKEL
jgi:ribosomal protein S18 acetylase RimI-like enzyme